MKLKSLSRTGKMCLICAVLLVFSTGFISLEQHLQSPQKSEENAMLQDGNEPNMGNLLLRTFMSLIAVLALLYLGAIGLKKYMQSRNGTGKAFSSLKILGSAFLGPKKAVYMVQAIDRILILGVTDAHVTLLSEITDKETLKTFPSMQEMGAKAAHHSFSEQLSTVLKGLKKNDG